MTSCPQDFEWVEARIDRVLTQYRESPKLLQLIRNVLRQAEVVAQSICDLPSYFDIDSAIGDQLTLIGKRIGWPRCHCVCSIQPVFGFACEGVPSDYPIAGFCDDNSTWINCGALGTSDICITDDEIYRKFLKVRRYQMMALFDLVSLEESIRIFFGDQAKVLDSGIGRVVIAPGRELTQAENLLLQLYPRVLPVASGIGVRFHFGTNLKVFGFGDGWGGFCEPLAESAALMTEDDEIITDENLDPILTGPLTRDAPWMCAIDVKPYECA